MLVLWLIAFFASLFFATTSAFPECTSSTAYLGMGNCTLELPCTPCIDRSEIKVRAVVHGQMSDVFWLGVRRAFETAATQMKIDFRLQLQARKSTIEMAQNIRDIVDTDQPDVLLSTITGTEVADAVRYASTKCIVMTLNTGGDLAKSVGSLAHFEADGFLGGVQAMTIFTEVAAARGVTLTTCMCMNHGPGASWSAPRVAGFKQECDALGLVWMGDPDTGIYVDESDRDTTKLFAANAIADFIAAGNGPTQAVAVFAMGVGPSQGVIDAIQDAGKPQNILFGHFDLNPDLLTSGDSLFGIGQSAWLQGYLPVVLSTIYVTTGNLMAHELYPTGPSFQRIAPDADESLNFAESFPVCDCPWLSGFESSLQCDATIAGIAPISDCPTTSRCTYPCTDIRKTKIVAVTHAHESDTFWFAVKAGAEQAARDLRLINFEFDLFGPPTSSRADAYSPAVYEQTVRDTADRSDVDGMILSIVDTFIHDDITYAASRKLLITINSGSDVSASLNPANGQLIHHVGQDEFSAGAFAATRLKEAGATTIALVRNQEAEARWRGAATVPGVTFVLLDMRADGVPLDDDNAIQTYVMNAMTATPTINGILTLSKDQVTATLLAVKAAGKSPASFWCGSFDTSPTLLRAIDSGDFFLFGIDQQPYMQGYMGVLGIAVYKLTQQKLAVHTIRSGPFFVISTDERKDACRDQAWREDVVGTALMPFADDAFVKGFPVCKRPDNCAMSDVFNMTTLTCEKCAAGRFKNSSIGMCSNCPAGTFSETGSTSCTNCEPGKFAPPVSDECRYCERGRYAALPGVAACTQCAGDFTTKEIASRDSADCVCPEDKYRLSGGGSCSPCKEGMTCAVGSDEDNYQYMGTPLAQQNVYPLLNEGFWSSRSDPLSVYVCETEHHCPGGDPGACGDNLEGPSCSACKDEWHWTGESCEKCSSVDTSKFIFPTIPLILGPLIIVTMYKSFGDPVERWGSWKNGCAAIGFILINHYQGIALMGSAKINLPSMMKGTYNIWSFTNNLLTIFNLECTGFATFESTMIVRSVGPLIILAMCLLIFAVSYLIKGLAMDPDRLFNVYMSLIYTFFGAVVDLSLALVKCTENPNGDYTLTSDLSIICYKSDTWQGMLVVGIICVLVYVVGCGGLFVYSISVATKRFQDPGFRMRWKFLYIKYRPDAFWWSLVFLLKNALLNLSFVIFQTQTVSQYYWMLTITIVYLGLVGAFLPYRHRLSNMLEIVSGVSLIYNSTTCAVLAYDQSDRSQESALSIASALICFTPIALGLSILVYIVYRNKVVFQKIEYEMQDQSKDILAAFHKLGGCSGDQGLLFMQNLGEWDRWFLSQASRIIQLEFLGGNKFMQRLSKDFGELGEEVKLKEREQVGQEQVSQEMMTKNVAEEVANIAEEVAKLQHEYRKLWQRTSGQVPEAKLSTASIISDETEFPQESFSLSSPKSLSVRSATPTPSARAMA